MQKDHDFDVLNEKFISLKKHADKIFLISMHSGNSAKMQTVISVMKICTDTLRKSTENMEKVIQKLETQ